MVHPTVNVMGKTVILLSGYRKAARDDRSTDVTVALAIEAPERLLSSVSKNPDAVAFGFTAGKWFAAA